MSIKNNKPVVLCFSGLDPTGGAGIQADIESISAQGAHAACIITALTIQNTHNVLNFDPVDPNIITQQAQTILNDMDISAIKIGMLGSIGVTEAIHDIIKNNADIPVIFDPVLAAGGGGELTQKTLVDAINQLIAPYCYIITPNIPEAEQLTNKTDQKSAALHLLNIGTKYVLITGTHANTQQVKHHLYFNNTLLKTFSYSRLDGEYHGSGCTLTASIAALIAHKNDALYAVESALQYCHKTLIHAQALGKGQRIPDRFYLAHKNDA